MSNKRSKIFMLKQKLTEMQNQLQKLQKHQENVRQSISPRKSTVSPQRSNSKNRQYKSPTFWSSNPITHDDKYSPKKHQRLFSPNRSETKQNIQRNSSPTLKNIINTVDKKYYNSTIEYRQKETQPIQYFYDTAYQGKRFQNSIFGQTRGNQINQGRIRTFDLKKTDTIINPQKQKYSCRKMVKQIPKSPEKMLVENQKSNPNMYYYGNKTMVLEKKGNLQDKNKSNVILAHSTSQLFTGRTDLNDFQKKRKRSQRKHFSKYFEETLCSAFE